MTGPHFDGPVYEPRYDFARLTKQHERIRETMRDGAWRTLDEIARLTGDPVASISAQLRHLRKARFGSWVVSKRHRGERAAGLWEYRLDSQASQNPAGRGGDAPSVGNAAALTSAASAPGQRVVKASPLGGNAPAADAPNGSSERDSRERPAHLPPVPKGQLPLLGRAA